MRPTASHNPYTPEQAKESADWQQGTREGGCLSCGHFELSFQADGHQVIAKTKGRVPAESMATDPVTANPRSRLLPTFVGIGVPRAGTTWLHDLLASHEAIYMPAKKKELHYFDRRFDRGLLWYSTFFPRQTTAGHYSQIGEITPHYLYCPACPERIRNVPSIQRFILLLRNPVMRAYSHYGLKVRDNGFRGSFEEFVESYPEALEWGFYGRHLKRYLAVFDVRQMLILIYEEATADIKSTMQRLGDFLEVPVGGFSFAAGRRINSSYVVRAGNAHARVMKLVRFLRKADQDWLVNCGKRVGMKRMFGKKGALPPISSDAQRRFSEVYGRDRQELENLLGRDLSAYW